MAETLRSGGVEYEAGWLTCQAAASFRAGEAVVRVRAVNFEQPLGFFVDTDLVEPDQLSKDEVDGKVKVIVFEKNGGTSIISVPGEPVSFGPRISVANDQFVQ
jgi:hypothetical protein